MYKAKLHQLSFEEFTQPFGGKLDPNNRWVKLSEIIPWHIAEEFYANQFSSKRGAPALPVRMALGALIVKEKLGLSDQETVEHITENPYMQFFIGLESYQYEPAFDASMMTHFRKRLKHTDLNDLQEKLLKLCLKQEQKKPKEAGKSDEKNNDQESDSDDDLGDMPNKGKLIIDATCAPADIGYPTDIKLLNETREKAEEIIDELHANMPKGTSKPRTYRQNARKAFLGVSMKKQASNKVLRKGNRKQLNYIARDLRVIDAQLQSVPLSVLNKRQYKNLLIIHEIYRQQLEMYSTTSNRISDRLVSISQPHVRPMVRGKVGAGTEFGMKLSLSLVDGMCLPERMSWNNYNEGALLIAHIESYRKRFGRYPESVHADKIYRNRENRKACKERGIRMSGLPLGRPPKDPEKNKEKHQQIKEDEGVRNAVEGKFGQGKRRYSLNRVMARLADSSLTVVSIIFLVMNLDKMLTIHLLSLFKWLSFRLGLRNNALFFQTTRLDGTFYFAMEG